MYDINSKQYLTQQVYLLKVGKHGFNVLLTTVNTD